MAAIANSPFDQRNIQRFVVAQAAAGTTVIAAAVVGQRHKLLGFWLGMANNGTIKFIDGSGDLTGGSGGAGIPQQSSTPSIIHPPGLIPLVQTAVNSALSIVTTGGAAKGVVVFVTEA